jgi:NAD(P)-dependent dehydrogenase (short-subunit alcohol dehydrogenase family)
LFGRIEREEERLDVLANAVWGGGDAYGSADDWIASMGRPFWERSADLWRHMMVAGPYAYYLASAHAARLMAAHGGGLIVSVTDGLVEGASGDEYQGQLMWDVAHRCIDRMMAGMSEECRKHGIAVVTLMPGFMQTERVVRLLTTDALRKQFRFDLSESTEYVGRAVAALAADRNVMRQSGRVHFVADLAEEYGFTDIDGRRVPRFAPFG